MKKKGFTLIELIIVMVILGILAAVLIPIFKGKPEAPKLPGPNDVNAVRAVEPCLPAE